MPRINIRHSIGGEDVVMVRLGGVRRECGGERGTLWHKEAHREDREDGEGEMLVGVMEDGWEGRGRAVVKVRGE